MAALDIPDLVLTVAGTIVLLPALVLLLEILAAWLPERGSKPVHLPDATFAVLVPAHDEAIGIAATIQGLNSQLTPRDRIVVIADNCSDETGTIANANGAEVIYRNDPSRRGKGYALDFGVRHLESAPPDVVIVVDADCQVEPGTLGTIASLSAQSGRPVQARYDFERPPGVTDLAMATFATRIKNYLRPLGMARLGLPCQLLGTGMAFPWAVISRAALASGEIVEDMVLGLELGRDGVPPMYCSKARVVSYFPPSQDGQSTQRARWESGHLLTIFRRLPALLIGALMRGNVAAAAMIIDLAVPPLALLLLSSVFLSGASLVLALAGGSFVPLFLSIFACAAIAGAVLLAWWHTGREIVPLSHLASAPGYAISKVGLYLQIFLGKRVSWVRSKRD